jgi:hypothetical protein
MIKKKCLSCRWLTPVILAAQEAVIRQILVQSQPWANSSGDRISRKTFTKKRSAGVAQALRTPA